MESGEHCISNPALGTELSFPFDFHWRVIMPIRIVLADDHVLVRQGLKSLLEREKFQVVAEASDGQEAVRLTEEHHPDIAVLDISMPTLNGIVAAPAQPRSRPQKKKNFPSPHEEKKKIHQTPQTRAKGDILKKKSARDPTYANSKGSLEE